MSTTSTPILKAVRSGSPSFEPLTRDEAKKHLELPADYTYHDVYLDDLIVLAREMVEHDTGLAVASGTWIMKATEWPCGDWLLLPVRPVTTITSIQYIDSGGSTQTWASSNYTLSTYSVSPAVFLAYGSSWPSHRGHYQDITVTFVAGYAAATSMPMLVRHACRLALARAFADREGSTFDESQSRAYELLVRRVQRSTYP